MVETALNAVGKTDKKNPYSGEASKWRAISKKNMSGFCMTYKQRSLTANDK